MKSLFTKSTILSIGMIAFLFVTMAPINAADETEATSSEEVTTPTEETTAEQSDAESSTKNVAADDEASLPLTIAQFEALQKVMLDQADAQTKFQKDFQAWEDNFVKNLDAQIGETTQADEAKK